MRPLLVLNAWRPYGLLDVTALFPPHGSASTIAVCVCTFKDEASIQTAFDSPEAKAVMEDIGRFTDARPVQLQGVPI